MAVEQRMKKGSSKKKTFPPQQRRNFDPNYFRWPHPFWMFVISSSIWLLVTSTLLPRSIPTFLGPIATYGKFMGNTYPNLCIYLCAFTLITHTLEAAFAGKVCHDRGMTTSTTIKWTISTFIFGFPSLVFRLLPYRPDVKTM